MLGLRERELHFYYCYPTPPESGWRYNQGWVQPQPHLSFELAACRYEVVYQRLSFSLSKYQTLKIFNTEILRL